ncbi:hypothetical protein [Carnobacterium sp. ISL-102]|uniref:hypothetical protein n=1 Tax=Carnobacterium sp. ISL-102 TaxID=2819142 RepID=UPI001BE7186A|nr:hypothetical protein [Carnobacterium sp. ISL-102]MBT2732600.1 hypothetical protein [Carnobacterium sp. ISL-102]
MQNYCIGGILYNFHCRKRMKMVDNDVSLQAISASTGNGRPKVTEILQLAKEKGLKCPLSEEMDDQWIEDFLYLPSPFMYSFTTIHLNSKLYLAIKK